MGNDLQLYFWGCYLFTVWCMDGYMVVGLGLYIFYSISQKNALIL